VTSRHGPSSFQGIEVCASCQIEGLRDTCCLFNGQLEVDTQLGHLSTSIAVEPSQPTCRDLAWRVYQEIDTPHWDHPRTCGDDVNHWERSGSLPVPAEPGDHSEIRKKILALPVEERQELARFYIETEILIFECLIREGGDPPTPAHLRDKR
jgi:hypothetical protein